MYKFECSQATFQIIQVWKLLSNWIQDDGLTEMIFLSPNDMESFSEIIIISYLFMSCQFPQEYKVITSWKQFRDYKPEASHKMSQSEQPPLTNKSGGKKNHAVENKPFFGLCKYQYQSIMTAPKLPEYKWWCTLFQELSCNLALEAWKPLTLQFLTDIWFNMQYGYIKSSIISIRISIYYLRLSYYMKII
jgi:hypothetical protein